MFHSFEEEAALDGLKAAIKEGDPARTARALERWEESRWTSPDDYKPYVRPPGGERAPPDAGLKAKDYGPLNGQEIHDLAERETQEGFSAHVFVRWEPRRNGRGKRFSVRGKAEGSQRWQARNAGHYERYISELEVNAMVQAAREEVLKMQRDREK